jgi:hypothetical protein
LLTPPIQSQNVRVTDGEGDGRERRRRWLWAGALIALFAFRLFFGLSSNLFSEDQTQIFLIGLTYYATGRWPYYGPDVVWTKSEIPGALQGLLVGLPLKIAALPEAPYVVVNLLSMGALCLFAWYLTKRLPSAPRWLIVGWLLTVPWTLEYSTNIINTSYVLPGGLLFFIGFFEAWPTLTRKLIPPAAAFFLMGFAIFWILQFHMSGAILLAFVGAALVARVREGARDVIGAAAGFALGALSTASLIFPTLWTFGTSSGSGGILHNLEWQWRSPWILLKTVARMLSFPSLEVGNFLGTGADRVVFVEHHLALVPLLLVVTILGFAQPVWMAATWFRRRSTVAADWPSVRWLLAATVALVYISYYFVMEKTEARAYYLTAPVAFAYAAYCWTFVDSPRTRRLAAVAMAVNIGYQFGVAWTRLPGHSLYQDRALVAAAIAAKEPDLFAHHRYFGKGLTPDQVVPLAAMTEATESLEVLHATWSREGFGVSHWSVAVRNHSATFGYRDLVYETTYLDAAGKVVDVQSDRIEVVLEPGESQSAEFTDGMVPGSVAYATFRIVRAEPLRPLPANSKLGHMD